MPYRPALARLRRSTAYGVLGLAAIAIAGCDRTTDRSPAAGGRYCHNGLLYRDSVGDGVYVKERNMSGVVPCVAPAQIKPEGK